MFAGALAAAAPRARSKSKVVVTGGHPGDPEYGCGGTAARYAERGDDVVFLYLNTGNTECGATRPEQSPRVAEAVRACAILKARPRFAGQCDGHAVVDAEHVAALQKMLEAEGPDVVFTHWPVDGHADHRAMASLTMEAWAKMRRGFALYFYEVSDGEDTFLFTPTEYVDITRVEAVKRAACYAHASQSPERYYELQRKVALFRGVESGFGQAEGFARHPRGPRGVLP